MKKKEIEALFWLIVIGLPIFIILSLIESIGWVSFILVLALIVGIILWYKNKKKKERIAYLTHKYHDEEIVNKIMNGYFWQGQTTEQLLDSLGKPVEIDKKIFKTKKKETWKYNLEGKNRFRLRITLENNIVIGWHQR